MSTLYLPGYYAICFIDLFFYTTASLSVPNYQESSMTKLSVWIEMIYVGNNMFTMIVVAQTTNDIFI